MVKSKCRFCGCEIVRRGTKTAIYCSILCKAKAQVRVGQATCKNCGKPIDRLKAIYCCHDCRNRGNYLNIDVKSAWQMYKHNSLQQVAVEFCVSRETLANRLKENGYKLRTKTSHLNTDKNPTKGKHHSNETKRKISKASIYQWSNPQNRIDAANRQIKALMSYRGRCKVSKIENIVADILIQMGISFKRQQPFRDEKTGKFCCLVDFQLKNNVVIEVNGTFWHTDPRKYPKGPICQIQQKILEKYNRKLKFLSEHNIHVIELWEIDIKENINYVQKMLNPYMENSNGLEK